MSKLHIFDMDGTLLRGSACLELARHLGQFEAVSSIEDRWVRGEVSHLAFWEECLPLWEGLDDAIDRQDVRGDLVDERYRSSMG